MADRSYGTSSTHNMHSVKSEGDTPLAPSGYSLRPHRSKSSASSTPKQTNPGNFKPPKPLPSSSSQASRNDNFTPSAEDLQFFKNETNGETISNTAPKGRHQLWNHDDRAYPIITDTFSDDDMKKLKSEPFENFFADPNNSSKIKSVFRAGIYVMQVGTHHFTKADVQTHMDAMVFKGSDVRRLTVENVPEPANYKRVAAPNYENSKRPTREKPLGAYIIRERDYVRKTASKKKKKEEETTTTGKEYRDEGLEEFKKNEDMKKFLDTKDPLAKADLFLDIMKKQPKLLYINSIHGTFMDPELAGTWNFDNLQTLLKSVESYRKAQGVTSSFLYYALWFSPFPVHTEDAFLWSINIMYVGEIGKLWIAVGPEHAEALEKFVQDRYADQVKGLDKDCRSWLRHKLTFLDPRILPAHIEWDWTIQKPGQIVITCPKGYHWGWSLGPSISEASNFATPAWLDMGLVAPVDMVCAEVPYNIFFPNMRQMAQWYMPDKPEIFNGLVEETLEMYDPAESLFSERDPASKNEKIKVEVGPFRSFEKCYNLFDTGYEKMRVLVKTHKDYEALSGLLYVLLSEMAYFSMYSIKNHEKLASILHKINDMHNFDAAWTVDDNWYQYYGKVITELAKSGKLADAFAIIASGADVARVYKAMFSIEILIGKFRLYGKVGHPGQVEHRGREYIACSFIISLLASDFYPKCLSREEEEAIVRDIIRTWRSSDRIYMDAYIRGYPSTFIDDLESKNDLVVCLASFNLAQTLICGDFGWKEITEAYFQKHVDAKVKVKAKFYKTKDNICKGFLGEVLRKLGDTDIRDIGGSGCVSVEHQFGQVDDLSSSEAPVASSSARIPKRQNGGGRNDEEPSKKTPKFTKLAEIEGSYTVVKVKRGMSPPLALRHFMTVEEKKEVAERKKKPGRNKRNFYKCNYCGDEFGRSDHMVKHRNAYPNGECDENDKEKQ